MIVYKELSSLCFDLGFNPKALYALSNHTASHYKTKIIPKKDGSERVLHVPDNFLKSVQRSISDNLLSYEYVSPHAFAYKQGTSVVENARPHLGRKNVLKLDILHFFDSITYPLVKEKVFVSEKYSEANRILLSLLCVYKDSLAQGAPSSPAISNIIMRDFDDKIGEICRRDGIVYTRYCDDMSFSGDFDVSLIKNIVSDELRKMGFFLNGKKTVVASDGKLKSITGIVVNEKLNTPASYRDAIRKDIYYCRKFGVLSHMSRIGAGTDENGYLHSLLGRIGYVLSVDGANEEMKEYRAWASARVKDGMIC